MTTSSKNLTATLILALSKICDEQEIANFCAKHQYSPAKCYLCATEIADPGKLITALDEAEQEIAAKAKDGINILTIFDYGSQVDKNYIFYQGNIDILSQPKFTINMSHVSNVLAMRVEEVLEAISKVPGAENLVMVGGASSSFASCVKYKKCNRPVIMTAEKDLGGFRNSIADCLIYDIRPSDLKPVLLTFDLISVDSDGDVKVKGLRQTVADVANREINITKLGLDTAAQEIVDIIMEAKNEQ